MQKKGLTVSSGATWRKTREEGLPVKLPSGHVVALRNVSIAGLMASGAISDPLSHIVYEMIYTGDGKTSKKVTPKESIDATIELQAAVCKLAFVNPRIVDTPEADNEISMQDVNDQDAQFVLSLLYTSAEVLASRFPEEPPADVPDLEQIAAVPDTAQ